MKKILFLLTLIAVTAMSVIGGQAVQPGPAFGTATLNTIQDRLKRKKASSKPKRSFFSVDFDSKLFLLSSSKKADLLIDQARIYKKAGITDSFIRSIRRAIDASDGNSSVLATVTSLLTRSQDKNDCNYALELTSSHLESHPADESAFGSRAKARGCLGDLLGAFDDLTTALKLKPEDRFYLLDRGNIPNRITDNHKALELCQIVIEENKRSAEKARPEHLAITFKSLLASSYVSRSFIYRKLGDKDRQLADLSSAVDAYPEANLRVRASTYQQYKMFDLAISDMTNHIRLQGLRYGPRNQKYLWQDYVYRANLYADAGRIMEAIADYQKAIELFPDNREWLEKQISLLNKTP
ncbi:MAG: tetratricopeptide repeat protein [Pyrinomonadaceae bacterium]|nr:tetratricopeptide repeat protein [Pyrinomonadaceae bacterium]